MIIMLFKLVNTYLLSAIAVSTTNRALNVNAGMVVRAITIIELISPIYIMCTVISKQTLQ